MIYLPPIHENPPARWFQVAVLTAMTLACNLGHAQTGLAACGDPFRNHFGPFDYRSAPAQTRALVESVHFTPGVETVTRPGTTMLHDVAQDIAYTLSVFPNHHRALLSMEKASERFRSDPAPSAKLPVECWYDRAIRFRPDDTVTRALYAQFLGKRKRVEDAVRQLEIATESAKENGLTHFNLGLVYFELRRYDRALERAHSALALGFPRTELVDKLKSVNQWSDPK